MKRGDLAELRRILDWYYDAVDDPSIPTQLAGVDQTCPRCGVKVGEVHAVDCLLSGRVHTGGATRGASSHKPASVRKIDRRAAIGTALSPSEKIGRLDRDEAELIEALWAFKRWLALASSAAKNKTNHEGCPRNADEWIMRKASIREIAASVRHWRKEIRRIESRPVLKRALQKLERARSEGRIW